jgi:tetratricopeptide (TPR) repeat protein
MYTDDWDNFQEEDEALEAVKRYRDMVARNIRVFFDLCEYESIIDYFVEQFNFKEALTAVKYALDQHPYASSVKLKHVQLLIETGKPAKALGMIRELQEMDGSNYELHLAKGIALNLTGKYTESLPVFESAISLCTDNKEEVAYNIAQSFIQTGRFAQAIHYLQVAYDLNPENVLVLYDLAYVYEKIDLPEESLKYYKQYIDLDPFAEHVWNNLGLIYTGLDNYELAMEAFDFAIAINPHYFSAYYNKADLCVLHNHFDLAIEVYYNLLLQDNSNTKALSDLGNCLEETRRFAEALKVYERAIEIAADCSDAWFGKGMVYFRQRKYRLSISSFRKAVALHAENSDYWFMLGEAFSKLRKFDQAIKAYSRAAELNPLDHEAWMACAQVMFRKKKIGEAINVLIRLYQRNHENPTINYRLAAYHVYQLDLVNAGKYFEKALRLNFSEHSDMFRQFPKTKSVAGFKIMIEQYIPATAASKKNKIK